VAAAKVVFHPGASEDYAAAFAWYYALGTKIAADFESEIDRSIRLISQYPLRWPKFDEERRRLIVRKFPYSIILNCTAMMRWFSLSPTASDDLTTGAIAPQTNKMNQPPLRPHRCES
jgi:toxin ParE1/3/4